MSNERPSTKRLARATPNITLPVIDCDESSSKSVKIQLNQKSSNKSIFSSPKYNKISVASNSNIAQSKMKIQRKLKSEPHKKLISNTNLQNHQKAISNKGIKNENFKDKKGFHHEYEINSNENISCCFNMCSSKQANKSKLNETIKTEV